MNNPDHIYTNFRDHLSHDQLIRYQEDSMGDAEMHRAERHLLGCELCSDALDGISMLKPQQADAHFQDLQSRLSGRLREEDNTSSPSYWKWAAAAAVLLMAVSVLFLLNNYWGDQLQGRQEIVQQENGDAQETAAVPAFEAEKDSIKAVQPADSPGNEQIENQDTNQAERIEEALPPQAAAPALELAEAGEPNPAAKEPAETGREESLTEEVIIEEVILEEKPMTGIETDMDTFQDIEIDSSFLPVPTGKHIAEKENYIVGRNVTSMRGALKPARESSAYKELKGKITDAYGDPIPGVSIRIKGTDKGTLTDMQGSYSLRLPASDTSLMISFIGYVDKEVNIKDTATRMEAVLEEDVATLSEVVVTGYGRQRAATEKPAITLPQPKGGKRGYKKYLKSNRSYTPEAREAGVEGVVVVEFFVAPDGSLENLEIKKSLGYGLDEEAIRLIQDGPIWQPATSANQPVRHKMRVRVPFRLD